MLKQRYYQYGKGEIRVPATLNLGEYVLSKLMEHKDKFIINGATHEELKYGEIAQVSMNLSLSLSRLNVKKGEVVAVCSENRKEFCSTVVGVVCTGATLTAINVGYSSGEIKHVMSITKPKYIICSPQALKIHEKTFRSHNFIKTIIVYSEEKIPGTLSYNELTVPSPNSMGDVIFDRNGRLNRNVNFEEFQAAEVLGQTGTALVLYSSGTTGLPKGVMLTHLNLLSLCSLTNNVDTNLVNLVITPWYHTMGLVGTLMGICAGRKIVFLPKFQEELYLQTIERYKVTHLTVVPPVLVALCKYQSDHDVSSVSVISCGAAPLHKETLSDVHQRFPGLQAVLQAYGMTETTLVVIRDMGTQYKPGSVGTPVAGSIIKVVDVETGNVLGPNQRGEIYIKGVIVMKGYIGKDKKEDFDSEGFFKTGDIGYFDDDGYFFIVDRLKELIKYKGYQVPPAEVEATLLKHEVVKDAGVIGIDDKIAGEVPLAFVVKQPGKDVTEKELQQFVAQELSNPKHLRGGVRFVNEIPKNPSGKILRRLLKTMAKTEKSKL